RQTDGYSIETVTGHYSSFLKGTSDEMDEYPLMKRHCLVMDRPMIIAQLIKMAINLKRESRMVMIQHIVARQGSELECVFAKRLKRVIGSAVITILVRPSQSTFFMVSAIIEDNNGS
ncbi:hypothetical protein BDB00DRAFT_768740, partial [Zychaea mexicana]|uniref:uncharacterized protein n=1 Tax=Zychaea mexicana TaxID=64656 RepID=UPI0022FDF33F